MTQNKSYGKPTLMDVLTVNTPTTRKLYTKKQRTDGNTEYTVRYRVGINTLPGFTKILVNPKNKILAYIDVQRVPEQYASTFKTWKWFGIQEFHPELIGDFKHVVTDKENDNFFGDTWQHKTDEHLYVLQTERKDWYRVHTDLWYKGMIETNYHAWIEYDTRFYKYNTHPSVPTPRIENLTRAILIDDGMIKPKCILTKSQLLQKVKDFLKRAK